MSNVLEVWPKGVRWQVWGAGGRRWRLVLTYLAASCNFRSNFNCDNVNMYDARCSNIPSLVHWIPETNAGRVDHQDHSGDKWQWKSEREALLKPTIHCKPNYFLQDLATLIITDNGWPFWHCRYVVDVLLLLISDTFLARLAKWFHPCNCRQPISFWQQLWAVPTLPSLTPPVSLHHSCSAVAEL